MVKEGVIQRQGTLALTISILPVHPDEDNEQVQQMRVTCDESEGSFLWDKTDARSCEYT